MVQRQTIMSVGMGKNEDPSKILVSWLGLRLTQLDDSLSCRAATLVRNAAINVAIWYSYLAKGFKL